MFPQFAAIMLIISAIHVLASVAAMRMASKKLQIFMKVMKTVMGLNMVVGILDIVAVILYLI
jgi:hypothetical protein